MLNLLFEGGTNVDPSEAKNKIPLFVSILQLTEFDERGICLRKSGTND